VQPFLTAPSVAASGTRKSAQQREAAPQAAFMESFQRVIVSVKVEPNKAPYIFRYKISIGGVADHARTVQVRAIVARCLCAIHLKMLFAPIPQETGNFRRLEPKFVRCFRALEQISLFQK
jgi:hypothetical protein